MKAFLSPLSQEEEKECLTKLKSGDVLAKEELILHNMRLVAHVAKKYQNEEEDLEDLISIGTIGLLKAVSTFDYNYGNHYALIGKELSDSFSPKRIVVIQMK